MLSSLMFKSLIYFELVFVSGVILCMAFLQSLDTLKCCCSNSAIYLLQLPSFGSGWLQGLRSLGHFLPSPCPALDRAEWVILTDVGET